MNIQDPISDMIVRIKNGQLSKKKIVYCKYSKIKKEILKILKLEGFIINYNINNNIIEISLKYFNDIPVIDNIKRISKPSVRIYYKLKDINKLKCNTGIIIISTSKGLINHKLAKKNKIGGEAICSVY